MKHCKHLNRVGDNYGESCRDCGAQLSGYGWGGWFGRNLTEERTCIHLWSPVGDGKICIYCQAWSEVLKIKPDPNCKSCHGEGEAFDIVDYGSTTASMPTLCDCVVEQVPEGREDLEIELVFDRE